MPRHDLGLKMLESWFKNDRQDTAARKSFSLALAHRLTNRQTFVSLGAKLYSLQPHYGWKSNFTFDCSAASFDGDPIVS
jgi:hypothetical protein